MSSQKAAPRPPAQEITGKASFQNCSELPVYDPCPAPAGKTSGSRGRSGEGGRLWAAPSTAQQGRLLKPAQAGRGFRRPSRASDRLPSPTLRAGGEQQGGGPGPAGPGRSVGTGRTAVSCRQAHFLTVFQGNPETAAVAVRCLTRLRTWAGRGETEVTGLSVPTVTTFISNSLNSVRSEKRHRRSLAAAEFECRLELEVGRPVSGTEPEPCAADEKFRCELMGGGALGSRPVGNSRRLRVLAGHGSARRGECEDVSEVEKEKISQEAYDQRPDSVHSFLKHSKLGWFNEEEQAQREAETTQRLGEEPEQASAIPVGGRCEVRALGQPPRRSTVTCGGLTDFECHWMGICYDEPLGKNNVLRCEVTRALTRSGVKACRLTGSKHIGVFVSRNFLWLKAAGYCARSSRGQRPALGVTGRNHSVGDPPRESPPRSAGGSLVSLGSWSWREAHGVESKAQFFRSEDSQARLHPS
ncbi:LOW QUALITY PROTEIN: uncharacterized protein AAES06_024151 [Glossophaga mutica]